MKVNSINSLYNNFVVKQQVKETKTIQQEQKTLMTNSLSEAIGRSQVAFKGINKINPQGNFIHSCVEGNGSRENIVYDPKTGNFQHSEYDENGKIKKSMVFYHYERKNITTEYETNGSKTITTETPANKVVQVIDSKGREERRITSNQSGIQEEIFNDYANNRKIVSDMGIKSVYDLTTGKQIFFGPLTHIEEYDEKQNADITRNVITGNIVRVKQYNKKDYIESDTEYNEYTNKFLKRTIYGKRDGEYQYFEYDETTGILILSVDSRKKGNIYRTKTYDANSRQLTSDNEEIYKNGMLIKEREYYLNTDTVKVQKTYDEENCEIEYFSASGRISKSETYCEGKLTEECFYNTQTKNIERKVYNNYEKDRKIIVMYNQRGKKSQKAISSLSSGAILGVINYYENGNKKDVTKWNEQTKESIQEFYDKNGILLKKRNLDSNNNLKRETFYFDDGETPYQENTYYDNGTSRVISFDEYGNVIETKYYDAFGREYEPYQQNSYNNYNSYNNGYNHSNYTNTRTQARRTKPTSEQEKKVFLNDILHILTCKNLQTNETVTDSDFKILAELIGVDDYTTLKDLDDKTFKKLAFKFHPDVNENEEEANKIMQILNELRHKN